MIGWLERGRRGARDHVGRRRGMGGWALNGCTTGTGEVVEVAIEKRRRRDERGIGDF